MDWNSFVDGVGKLGTTAGDVYNSFKSDDSSDEAAYLRGQNDALTAQAKAQQEAGTLKIGDLSLSTTSLLWIIAGTLGLLAIGAGVKKLI